MDKELNFLIEQIETDLDAGYITERAKWREKIENDPVYTKPNGAPSVLRKEHIKSKVRRDDTLMKQTSDEDPNDNHRTSMHKSIIADGLQKALKNEDFSPEAVAEEVGIAFYNAVETATLNPKTVVSLCRQFIQSALVSTGIDGKSSYRKDSRYFIFGVEGLRKKRELLLLLKTVKSPEFLKALKKYFGKNLTNPSRWLLKTDKPNTKGRFSDV